MLPHVLFEKYIIILALEMASPGNRYCASCIGTLSFSIRKLLFKTKPNVYAQRQIQELVVRG